MPIEIVYNGEVLSSIDTSDMAPALPAAKPIQRIALVGASVMDQSFNSSEARYEMMQLLANAGATEILSVNSTYSNSGDDSADYLAKLPNMLSDASGFEGMLFIIHGFGNDVTRAGPWPGGADAYESAMRDITTQLQNAGHMVAWASVTYRMPGFSNPPAPYNARINIPVMEDLTPDFIRDGVPVFDYYNLTYQHQPFIESDGIHPTDRGQALIRGYTARRIADLLHPAEPARFEDFLGKSIIFTMGDGIHKTYSDGINGFVANYEASGPGATQGYGHCLQVYTTEGEPLNGVTLFTEHGNINTAGASTDSGEIDLFNALVVRESVWASPDVNGRCRIEGLPNGLTGTMTALAARDAGDSRMGDYTYRGVTQTMEGAWREGDEIQTLSWPFVVEDGYLQLDWQVSDGSDWAYLNGVRLDFDA